MAWGHMLCWSHVVVVVVVVLDQFDIDPWGDFTWNSSSLSSLTLRRSDPLRPPSCITGAEGQPDPSLHALSCGLSCPPRAVVLLVSL